MSFADPRHSAENMQAGLVTALRCNLDKRLQLALCRLLRRLSAAAIRRQAAQTIARTNRNELTLCGSLLLCYQLEHPAQSDRLSIKI